MIDYHVSAGVAELRLSAPPLNFLTLPLLEELAAAVHQANGDDTVRGLLIIGGDDHFSAGADINLFCEVRGPDDAVRLSRMFQEAFGKVERSDKPVAVAVAGRVMGGALELAMACHLRACDEATRFSMPEVTLGINPGAGGTQRLPRLVGAELALQMLLKAQTVKADEALRHGLVDAVGEKGELPGMARELLCSGAVWRRTCDRTDRIDAAEAVAVALEAARDEAATGPPELIAPGQIAEAVTVGLTQSFQAGLAQEQRSFAECMGTLSTRNKLYSFFATRGLAKSAAAEDSEESAGRLTGDEITALESFGVLNNIPAPARARAGCLVLRFLVSYLNEALALLEDGASPRSIDQAMMDFGFDKGPFEVIESMRGVHSSHAPVLPAVTRLLDAGCLGLESGFPVLDEVRRTPDRGARQIGPEEITERLVYRVIAEAFRVMEEQDAWREADIDAVMVLGLGFPDYRGGIVKYARDEGLGRVVRRLDQMHTTLGERFAVCELLRNMKGTT